jgi:hypothetical protein
VRAAKLPNGELEAADALIVIVPRFIDQRADWGSRHVLGQCNFSSSAKISFSITEFIIYSGFQFSQVQ